MLQLLLRGGLVMPTGDVDESAELQVLPGVTCRYAGLLDRRPDLGRQPQASDDRRDVRRQAFLGVDRGALEKQPGVRIVRDHAAERVDVATEVGSRAVHEQVSPETRDRNRELAE